MVTSRPIFLRDHETRRLVAATVAYAALTFLMALPLSASPGRLVVADAPDTHLFIWMLAWDAHAFLHQPLAIFDANIYYPYSNTLAYSENLIGTALIAAPIIWLTGNAVLAMNVAAMATCVLCGLGAYVLARRLNIRPGAAFLCGLVFAFAPPRFFKMGQLHMTSVQWMPFALACLHRYFAEGRRADLRKAVGFFSLQALCSGHGAVFLALASAMLVLWRLATGEPIALVRRVRDLGVTGAYLAAPAIWVLLPYRLAQSEAGLVRELDVALQPGLDSFVASPARLHIWLQELLLNSSFHDTAIAFLFPGILLMLLVAAALVPSRKTPPHPWTAFYAVLAAASAALFVQWPLDIWRFVYWWPGFNFIRAPARFMILTLLALSVLAAIGSERITAGLAPRRRTAVSALLALLLLAEYTSYPFAGVPFAIDIPQVDRWLDTRPKPFVVAEVPVPHPSNLGALERQQTMAMLHASGHWQKTIHGYSGIRRPLHDRLYRDLHTFPDAQSIVSLRATGVNYVVVHTEQYAANEWRAVEAQLAATPDLRLEHVAGSGRVYALVSPRMATAQDGAGATPPSP
jgi:hypothetical protein